MRKGMLAVGLVCLASGLVALALGFPAMMVLLVWGVLLVGGVAFERFRYKPLRSTKPGPGWRETPERFIDDETGAEVVVYVQPNTGERAYVRAGKTVAAPR